MGVKILSGFERNEGNTAVFVTENRFEVNPVTSGLNLVGEYMNLSEFVICIQHFLYIFRLLISYRNTIVTISGTNADMSLFI